MSTVDFSELGIRRDAHDAGVVTHDSVHTGTSVAGSLGEFSTDWKCIRLKWLFQVVNGATPSSSEDSYWDGDIPWATPDDLGKLRSPIIRSTNRQISRLGYESCGTTVVPAESLIVSTRAPIGHLAIAGMPLCVNQGCRCLVARVKLSPRYMYYQLLAGRQWLESRGQGSTFREMSASQLQDVRLAVPSFRRQCQIAAFLDQEVGRIEELLAKKERLIELLDEVRTSLINRAVTSGLNPDVRRCDTVNGWFENVPKHWMVVPLRRFWDVIDCKHLTVSFVDEGIPVASIGEVQAIDVDLSTAKKTTPDEYEKMITGGRRPKLGDVICSRNATIGAAAFVNTKEPFCMGQDVCMIRSALQNQRYLVHQLRSPCVASQLTAGSIGSTFKRINVGDIKALFLCVPPRAEQDAISEYCDHLHMKTGRAVEILQNGIERLQEYRAALISAVVTGKIDVRDTQG